MNLANSGVLDPRNAQLSVSKSIGDFDAASDLACKTSANDQ